MSALSLRIEGESVAVACPGQDQRRVEDLAKLLNTRLAAFSADLDVRERLALIALSLFDETQARAAALMRARGEIERLTDMLVDARDGAVLAAADNERGLVDALRPVNDAA